LKSETTLSSTLLENANADLFCSASPLNDSLSYLDYKKQKPNAKIKAIKGDAEQNKSAFAIYFVLHHL
jgi:hypothetical protein